MESALVQVKQTTWNIDGDQLRFQGLILAEEYTEEVMVRYTIASEQEKEELSSSIPSLLLVEGELKVPSSKTNFNQFDYQVYLERQDITYTLHGKHLTEIESDNSYLSQRYQFDSIRQSVLNYCDRTFKPITSRYIKALIFGDKRELSDEITSAFKNLGIIHLLSISGLHISLLIMITDKLLTKVTVTRETNRLIMLVFLPVFGVFAGFGISVFRAVVQAWIRCFSDLQKWSLTSLDCWSIAFISALLLNPSFIYSIGFQLSYSMSFLMLFISQLSFFNQYTIWKQISFLNTVLFLASIPILSFHYFEFSLGVLLFNSIYIPFVSYVLMPGLLFIFIMSPLISMSDLFSLIEIIMERVLFLMEEVTTVIDESVSLTFISGRLSYAVTIIWIIVFICALLVIEQKKSGYYLPGIAVVFMLLLHINKFSPFGQIVMIDVGQGDAIVIKEPFNKGNYLIDTGGTIQWGEKEHWQIRDNDFSLGSHVVIPVLKSFGIDKLDAIIITHPHWDHYGELVEIANNFTVEKIILNHYTFIHASFREELLKINDHKVAIELIDDDSQSKLPQSLVLINDKWIDDSNPNNQSTVLMGKYGKLIWLFTGDIEQEREKSILSHYPNLKADVLKVPHHGSASSTHDQFLNQLAPDYTLISVGENNFFGHPDQGTVSRLDDFNSINYRTDIHGSILYTYSENSLINRWFYRENPFKTINK